MRATTASEELTVRTPFVTPDLSDAKDLPRASAHRLAV
jgi:hypothetical protein